MIPDELDPKAWFEIVDGDLIRVRKMLQVDESEAAAFYLQQAAEKALKGFLLAHGWKLIRTHDLLQLVDEAIQYKPKLANYRVSMEQISRYYMTERYPTAHDIELSLDEVQSGLDVVKEMYQLIRATE